MMCHKKIKSEYLEEDDGEDDGEEDKEDVLSLEINSFNDVAKKTLVRLPKNKRKEANAIQSKIEIYIFFSFLPLHKNMIPLNKNISNIKVFVAPHPNHQKYTSGFGCPTVRPTTLTLLYKKL